MIQERPAVCKFPRATETPALTLETYRHSSVVPVRGSGGVAWKLPDRPDDEVAESGSTRVPSCAPDSGYAFLASSLK